MRNNIISVENLLAAWQEFLRGKRKRKDVTKFSLHFNDALFALHQELVEKTYRHGPYQAFKINDPKPRHIHKATVRDRLVHRALYRLLYPYCDSKFIYDSYSCRSKKGIHRALNRFRSFARRVSRNNSRTCWVLIGWVHFPHHRVLRTVTKRRAWRRIVQNPEPATMESYLGLLKYGNAHKIDTEMQKLFDNPGQSAQATKVQRVKKF